MNKNLLFILGTFMSVVANSQELQQSVYFDFGSNVTNRGVETSNPDANNNYWNNILANSGNYIAANSQFEGIVNSQNEATEISVTFQNRFTTNGLSGGGGLTNPQVDMLADMAVASATSDYIFIEKSEDNSSFIVAGLNIDRAYQFCLFASRSASDNRIGYYTLSGYNSFRGEMQAAGANLGGSGVNQNVSQTLITDYIFPKPDGTITITVSRKQGDYIPLNSMRLSEFTGVEKPVVVQYESMTLTGTAVEGGSVKMNNTILNKEKQSNVFETFVKLSAGTYSFVGTLNNGTEVSIGVGNSANSIKTNGENFVVDEEEVVQLTVDATNNTISFNKITGIYVTGSISSAGWSTNGEEITYDSNGVWKSDVEFTKDGTNSDPSRIVFLINRSWNQQLKSVAGERLKLGLAAQGYSLNDIRLTKGRYNIEIDLRNYKYVITPVDGIDPHRITVIGSSVANGQGATNNEGYAYLLGQNLQNRFSQGESDYPFYTSGVAINGNSTIDVGNRYDDLINNFGSYVIIGLGLGNEGLHESSNKEATYNQWKNNMLALVEKMQNDGKTVVVTNNYPRGDYNATDYDYVKKMNLEMQQWNIPTVNFLGVLDNCENNGQWAEGYQVQGDVYHPTTEGHQEMLSAFVPSLFDALAAQKTQPQRISVTEGFALQQDQSISLTPEAGVHSFTIYIKIKTQKASPCVSMNFENGEKLNIEVPQSLADGLWHTYALSYYYAAGKYVTYEDAAAVNAADCQQYALKNITINGDAEYADLMFYRAGMNADEIAAIEEGKMLKSSLEIYCPLANHSLDNLAQSTNSVEFNGSNVVTSVERKVEAKGSNIYYNLKGQRATKHSRGIVITNATKELKY